MRCNIAGKRRAASSPMTPRPGFNSARRIGYVRDNFTSTT
jgi:hypothetical protein